MKMKFKLDGPTIQDFLFKHVEKIVLGVVVLLLAGFVYLGTQLEGMTDLKSPDELMKLTTTAKNQLNREDVWKDFVGKGERTPVNDIPERVGRNLQSIDSTEYSLSKPWNLVDFPKQKMRGDPKVYAPTHVLATALYGPLAIKREGDSSGGSGGPGGLATGPVKDPLSGDMPVGATAGGENGGRSVVSAPPAASGEKKKKDKKGVADYNYGAEMMGGPMEGMMQPGGGPREGASHARKEGYLPGGTDGTFASGKAVVVMAAVPWEQQFDEYQRMLAEALDYRPERDFPNYLGYFVERADVTADPAAATDKLKWEPLSYNAARKETYTWQGFPAEVIDPDWCDLALTHPAPPFLFRDLTPALRHPEFPLLAEALAEMQAAADPRQAARMGKTPAGDSQDGFDAEGPSTPEGAMRNQPGANGAGRVKAPFQHQTPSSQGGGPGGRPEGGGMGGPGGASAGAKALEESVRKYKLLRFTDTTIKPGKIYRYRVKVVLEDPNHPKLPAQEPLVQSLDPKVKARLAAEEKKNARRTFLISSEWSEASEPVKLPPTEHFYAVSASPPKTGPIREDLPPFIDKDASGKALAVVWSEPKSVDVPGVAEVQRGTLLTFSKEAEVVHPVTATPRKVSNYSFATNAVVADIRGGETIKARNLKDESSLKSPAEMLVFDGSGKWHVLDETYDVDSRMRFAPEEKSEDGDAAVKSRPRPAPPSRREVGPGPGFGGEGALRGKGGMPPPQMMPKGKGSSKK